MYPDLGSSWSTAHALISKYVPIFHASARFAPKLRPPSDPLRPTVSPIQFESWWIAISPTEHYHPSDLISCSTFFSTLTHQAVAFTSGFLIPLVVSLFHPGKSRPRKRTKRSPKNAGSGDDGIWVACWGACWVACWCRWVWVNTYRYIFSGMNIHLPAILGFTRYQGFDPSPDDALIATTYCKNGGNVGNQVLLAKFGEGHRELSSVWHSYGR